MNIINLAYIYIYTYIHTYIHTYIYACMHTNIHRDVSVAKWLAWLAGNCGIICAIGSSPTYKIYIDVVIHQYIHTYTILSFIY